MKVKGCILFGGMGAGKDTVAELLSTKLLQRGIETITLNIGDTCRYFKPATNAKKEWADEERKFYQEIASKLREIDKDILNHFTYGRALDNPEKFHIIVGGRTEADYKYWKEQGFVDIGIVVEDSIALERAFKRDGFVDAKDKKHDTEVNAGQISKEKCSVKINNSGTLLDLEKEIEKVISSLKFKSIFK